MGPFEGGHHYLHYLPIDWSNNQGREHSPALQQKIGLKVYWLAQNKTQFPLSQSLPSGSFHKPLILLHQRADRLQTSHRTLTNLTTWTTALFNSVKLWAMLCGATQNGWVMVESSDKMWFHWKREWQITSVFLPWEYSPHKQYEKATR